MLYVYVNVDVIVLSLEVYVMVVRYWIDIILQGILYELNKNYDVIKLVIQSLIKLYK